MRHSKKRFSILLVTLFALLFGLAYANNGSFPINFKQDIEAQTTTIEWPQFQHDAQLTGRTSASVAPNYKVTWAWADKNHIVKNFVSTAGKNITDGFEPGFSFSVIFSQQMQPIVAGGKAYFGAMNGSIYAVDALTGDNRWDYQTGGPILGSAAYDNGTVIVGSLDGKVYGIDSNTGSLKWSYQTGAGVSAPPVITNGIAYIGSRDGKMYALTTSTGTLKWMYQTRVHPIDPNSPFNAAPIFTPAAVSADGTTVLFGAENMFFYALNTTDGTEKWTPKKLVGQSFLFGWPVVAGDKVIVRTMSSLPGAEFVMEDVLDGLPANPTMSEERTAILNWLNTNPHQKSMYVFDIATGNEPYQVGMGRVTGNNYAAHPPVLDNQGRLLTYWRSKVPTFIQNTACYGTKYCPDISAMNLATGERVPLTNNSGNKLAPELDNGFQPTVGGTYLYLANHFRGTHAINMSDGTLTRLTTQSAKWDCGDFRGWGFKVIYYGNDSEPSCTSTNAAPGSAYSNTGGYAGIAIATTSGRSLLYINEGDVGFIVAIEKQ